MLTVPRGLESTMVDRRGQHGGRSRKLGAHVFTKQREQTGSGYGCVIRKPDPSDILHPARLVVPRSQTAPPTGDIG